MSEPPLDVVVVTYECRALALECLASLRAHPPARGYRAVVVDNASSDGTADAVTAAFPEVEVIALERNRGFAFATNLGAARGDGSYLLALNPDTRVTAGALDATLAVLAERPEVAVVGARLVRPDGTLDHAGRRSFPTIVGALAHFLRVGRHPRAPRALAQYRATDVERGPVDAVNGAFMLLRRSAFEQVGKLDERYWMYMEDLDLCFRLREAGWTTWYESSAEVVHVKGGSSGTFRRPRINAAFHRSMLRFYRTHYAPSRNPLVNAAVYAGIGAKLAVSLVRSEIARRTGRS